MRNCLKKSTFNLFLFFAILSAVIIVFLSTTLGFKALLLENKSKLELQLSKYLKRDTIIESILYVPPNVLILKNISVSNAKGETKKGSPIFVKSIRLTFSLSKLLRQKNIVVNKAIFVNPRIDYNKHQIFFKENIEGIIKAIKFLARGRPLKLIFEEAEFIFGRKGSAGKMLFADAVFDIDLNRNIRSSGSLRYLKFSKNDAIRKFTDNLFSPEISYVFEGTLIPDGLSIARMEFDSINFQAALTGEIVKSVLKLKGFSSVSKNNVSSLPIGPNKVKELFKKLKDFIRYGRLPKKTGVAAGGINILDIDCLIKFESKHVMAKNVEFYLNKIPVRIQGEAIFSDKILTKLQFATFPDQNLKLRANNPQRLDVALTCSTKDGKTSGESDIIFLKTSSKGKSPHRIKTSFSNLSTGFLPDTRLKLWIETMSVQYSRDIGVFLFMHKDFGAMFNFVDKGIKFVKFNSNLYDGTLRGHIAGDIGQWPPKINCKLFVSNVSAWQLDSLLLSLFGAYRSLPTKLQGRIDGNFTCDLEYENYPEPILKGHTVITDGYLDNIKFFVWLGEFFGLPGLNQLKFRELSVHFESTHQASVLKNIKLTADKVFLEGNFSLNSNEFVTSMISIVLAREYLKTSGKFNLLLALMDKRTEYFNFDFQLSGVYKTLNFKWQKSAFKQRLKKMLPGFIERGLERKVERAIQSISAQNK